MKPGFLICFLIGSFLSDVQSDLQEIPVNKPVTFVCKVNKDNDEVVHWYKKPKVLLSSSLHVTGHHKRRMTITNPYDGEWLLTIERVEVTDTGSYFCQVSDTIVAEIDIVVHRPGPPEIHPTPDSTFNEGDTGIIWCNASGFPTPNITWYSKPRHQANGMGQDTGVKGNKLVLLNITRYYDNIYVCTATNTEGSRSAEIRIHVNFGPEVDILEANVRAALGEEVTLHCAVEAYPMDGLVEWAFENQSEPIVDNFRYQLSPDCDLEKDFHICFVSLIIRKGELGSTEYGQYYCRTKNFSRGYSEKVVVLQSN